MDRQQKIINKIFKILPAYEENKEYYTKYLSRVIIELSGEDMTEILSDTIVALKGLANQGEEVSHKDVRRIVFRYIDKLNLEYEYKEG